jgi:CelD/BcsL family acetyltransferase involved in cellulose biosynthesis
MGEWRVSRPTNQEWDRVFRDCPWATGFESPSWAEDWAASSGGALRPQPRRVELRDGTVAILPFCGAPLARGWLTRQVMPAGTFGGWLSRSPLERHHVASLTRFLRERIGELDLRISPYAPHAELTGSLASHFDETLATDLRQGFDAVLRTWSKGHRAAARQAERAGVTVSVARGLAEWEAYYEVYRRSRARWGDRAQSEHPWSLFEALARRDPEDAKLWLARAEGQVVAGALCLHAPRHVAYWHGAALEEFFPLRPVHLLMREAMRDAIERGRHWYDFNPSGGLAGVARFKRSFGTRPLPVPVVRTRSRRARAAARTRHWLDRGLRLAPR